MIFKRLVLIGLAVLMAGCAGAAFKVEVDSDLVENEAQKQRTIALDEWLSKVAYIERLYRPILEAADPLCTRKEDRIDDIGISYATKYDWEGEWQDVAINRFGLKSVPVIDSVAPGRAADIAGVQVGDSLVAVGEKSIRPGKRASSMVDKLIEKAIKKEGRVTLSFIRNSSPYKVTIVPENICYFPVRVYSSDEVNAWAGGRTVQVATGMIRYVENDWEMQVVLAHELAHNLLHHYEISGGKQREIEADYVGMLLMARAGLPTKGAGEIWRRMGVSHPGSISVKHAITHPSTPERFVMFQIYQKEIESRKSVGDDLLPNIDVSFKGITLGRTLLRSDPSEWLPEVE